jgi:hypothetical protein
VRGDQRIAERELCPEAVRAYRERLLCGFHSLVIALQSHQRRGAIVLCAEVFFGWLRSTLSSGARAPSKFLVPIKSAAIWIKTST